MSENYYEKQIKVLCHQVLFYYDVDADSLTDEQKNALDLEAEARAEYCIKEGYESGELNFDTEELSCRGWWNI